MKLSSFSECPNCQQTLAFRTEIDVDHLSPEERELVVAVTLNHRIVRCPNCKTLAEVRTVPPLPATVRIELVALENETAGQESETEILSLAAALNMAHGTEGIE